MPGVGEDEPVIIFKFAIIDLGKSSSDKNELIIKFISEINSTAIKQLAGDARAVAGPDFPSLSPRADPRPGKRQIFMSSEGSSAPVPWARVGHPTPTPARWSTQFQGLCGWGH